MQQPVTTMSDLTMDELADVEGGLTREQFAVFTCNLAYGAVGWLFGDFGAVVGTAAGAAAC